ncbi:hypothetical protein GCM10009715_03330 [Paeniglutamicibacter psychrophenolicus]|uniref:DUF4333 domain-containing protein n=1 Tax=Paeniglutamicibacter psychrophenolicus TaxID=257454 RepID=A0ABS4WAV7_9MICC|nr:hypothetical protein [Paeniglutamicibacter psychrophenolicus]MBP2373342.1 hypothetical protein [Paeniglutamicibacter psychrophenolicus]
MTAPSGIQPGFDPQHFQPAAHSAEKKHNPWVFGIVGLVAGVLIGLVAGFSSATPTVLDASANAATDAIPSAVETCQVVDSKGITVMDGGGSIELQTSGKSSWGTGAPFSDVTCVLDELGSPASIQARMETTRALDGRQTGSWSGFTVSWGYHPDDGLNVIVETQEQP